MNYPDYPDYWNFDESCGHWFSVGEQRVYGMITCQGPVVEYTFNDGSRPYKESTEFKTENEAKNFSIRFGRKMRNADKRNAVPTLSTFRSF